MHIIERFQNLPFSKSAISSFTLVPFEKILLRLEVLLEEQNFCDDCELQFNRVFHYNIHSRTAPWFGKILNISASKNSKYLMDCIEKNKLVFVQMHEFCHFSISTDNAKLEIIAEDFTFSIVRRGEFNDDVFCS